MPVRILDYTPFVDESGRLNSRGRIQGSLRYGSSWVSEINAQGVLVERLKRLLNDRFTLIRNFNLPDVDVQVPIILVGPTGMWVIYASEMSGFYAAQGKEWLGLDNNSGEYLPASPNPIVHTILVSRALQEFMQKHDAVGIDPEPIILFTDPGIDVTTENSEVRIVLIDALNRFIAGITQREQLLNPSQTLRIVEVIARQQKLASKKTRNEPTNPFSGLKFSPLQWIIIGTFLAINVIIILFIIAFLLTF